MSDYIHTHSPEEQERLFKQGKFLENIVYRAFDLSKYKNIAELGCGNGGNTTLLLEKAPDAKITAIDISPEQITAASNQITDPRATFKTGDICQLAAPDNQYDCAFICWVLEHLSDPQQAINEAYRILESGGQLLVTEVFNNSLYLYPETCPGILHYYKAFNDLQRSFNGFPNVGARLGSLLNNTGFQSIEIIAAPVLFDNRTPQLRNQMTDYYIDLLLSAKEELISRQLINSGLPDQMMSEKEAFKAHPDAVFHYMPIQAIATK